MTRSLVLKAQIEPTEAVSGPVVNLRHNVVCYRWLLFVTWCKATLGTAYNRLKRMTPCNHYQIVRPAGNLGGQAVACGLHLSKFLLKQSCVTVNDDIRHRLKRSKVG